MKRKAFTLVELMIASTILSIGIVMVLRSFLSSASVLDTGGNRIMAAQFLEQKMAGLEEEAVRNGEVDPLSSEEQLLLNNRKAVYTTEIAHLEDEAIAGKISLATLTLSWREANKERKKELSTYFRNQE